MKECPHCHVDTFRVLDSLALDYFSSTECKNCGKLVRNDGLRQLLMVLALVASVPITILVMSVSPEGLREFAWLVILILIALPIMLLPMPVKDERTEVTLSLFTPNSKNDKLIMVSGWNEDDIRKIVDDFIGEDDSGSPPRIEIHKQYGTQFRLTFPDDVHPALFASLVNYMMYPMQLGTADHSLAVIGKMTLDSAFPGIPESLIGQKAHLYVPQNDQKYDVVYMQTESGINLANSFAETSWRRIDEARMPLEVKRLLLTA